MFANAKVLVFVASCALLAQAQTPSSSAATSTPTLTPCIQNCLATSAGASTCVDPTNVTCACTSQAFQAAVGACLLTNCTQMDQQVAQQLQQAECSSLNGTTSSTASSAKGTATSASAASASASATHSNAASAMSAPLSLSAIFGTLVASAGALVGAAFVL